MVVLAVVIVISKCVENLYFKLYTNYNYEKLQMVNDAYSIHYGICGVM